MPTQPASHDEPAMPVLLGPTVDRWFFRFLNPAMKKITRHLPTGAAVIEHRGRKSGKPYETVVSAYRKGDTMAIALGHGKTDWLKNILAAGQADVRLFRKTVRITNLRVLPVGTTDPVLPWIVRLQARRAAILVADLA